MSQEFLPVTPLVPSAMRASASYGAGALAMLTHAHHPSYNHPSSRARANASKRFCAPTLPMACER